jgi:hypothetical protein
MDPHEEYDGDVLGGSPYMGRGGCGCDGGVSGGSPLSASNNSAWTFLKESARTVVNLAGVTDMHDAYESQQNGKSRWNTLSHLAFGVMKLCLIILIVLLIGDSTTGDWYVVLLMVFASISAVAWAGCEWKFSSEPKVDTSYSAQGALSGAANPPMSPSYEPTSATAAETPEPRETLL